MPEYIDTDVTVLRDSASDDEVTLLFDASGDHNEFSDRVEPSDATLEAKL